MTSSCGPECITGLPATPTSSSPATVTTAPIAPATTTPPTTPVATEPQPSVLGTVTVTGNGDTVTTSYTADPPILGTAGGIPIDVLETPCYWGSPETMVWVHGSVTITYKGSVGQDVGFLMPQASLITDGPNPATDLGEVVIASPDGSSWNGCTPRGGTSASNVWNYPFTPGQTGTYDMWIGYKLISNANPTFTPAQQKAMQIDFAPIATDQFVGSTATWAGPHAANCDDRNPDSAGRLLLFATAPISYSYTLYGTDNRTNCTPIG